MSPIASQFVLHPLVSRTLRLWSTTLGRDKTYRAIQYFARFLAWYLVARGHSLEAARWNALKAHLALGRKLMRLGKPIEHLQAALRASQAVGPQGEQLLTVGRQLGYFAYLAYDAVVWANAIKVISLRPDTATRVNKRANQFWFAGILFSLVHGIIKGSRLTSDAKRLHASSHAGEKNVGFEADKQQSLRSIQISQGAVHQQFLMDILDMWLPAANIGFITLNEGILGIFGFITSIMALRQPWAATAAKAAT